MSNKVARWRVRISLDVCLLSVYQVCQLDETDSVLVKTVETLLCWAALGFLMGFSDCIHALQSFSLLYLTGIGVHIMPLPCP